MARTDFFLGFGNGIATAFFGTLSLIGMALVVAVSIALIYISVRFMLTVTRAAQVYIDLNSAEAARARAADIATSASTASKPATKTAAKPAAKAAAKPAAKTTAAKSGAAAKPTGQPKG